MKKQRKHYTPEEKVAILRRHLLDKVPISELCDKDGLKPTVFYRWQKEFFEKGEDFEAARRVPGIQEPEPGWTQGQRSGAAVGYCSTGMLRMIQSMAAQSNGFSSQAGMRLLPAGEATRCPRRPQRMILSPGTRLS
jgi:transposase-like protein